MADYVVILTPQERHYLAYLVEQDYRKRVRGAAKLTPRPGQSADEFAQFQASVAGKLPFIVNVATKLTPEGHT